MVNAQVQPPAALNVAKEVFRVTEPLGTYQAGPGANRVDSPYLVLRSFKLWTRATQPALGEWQR